MTQGERLRFDKWLWAARLFRTRTLAAEAVALGRVRVNGERIKPAREARVGDRVEILAGGIRSEFEVRALSARRGPAQVARLLYEETPESRVQAERRRELAPLRVEPSRLLKGRPTKREGRLLRLIRETRRGAD
jgi:ribosome-associated heat shock protein Hsp15